MSANELSARIGGLTCAEEQSDYSALERFDPDGVSRPRYIDKPPLSLTDRTLVAVMHEPGTADVMTEDAHMEHVGHGFRRAPIAAA